MRIERIFYVRLSESDQLEAFLDGAMSLEEAREGRGYLAIRLDGHSDDARRLADLLEEREIEHEVQEIRHFSRKEIRSALALHVDPARREIDCRPLDRDTYDWSEVCDRCMRVPFQQGPIAVLPGQLAGARVARGRRGELLVEERIARRMISEGITGALLREVWFSEGGRTLPSPWFQILPMNALPPTVSPPTRFAASEEPCPACGRGGLHLDSMLFYDLDQQDMHDLNVTAELFGEGPGLFPEMVVSRRFFNLLLSCGAEIDRPEPVMFV